MLKLRSYNSLLEKLYRISECLKVQMITLVTNCLKWTVLNAQQEFKNIIVEIQLNISVHAQIMFLNWGG